MVLCGHLMSMLTWQRNKRRERKGGEEGVAIRRGGEGDGRSGKGRWMGGVGRGGGWEEWGGR